MNFVQLYWDTIKEDLFEVLREIFDKFEICDSQCRGMLTLLQYVMECFNLGLKFRKWVYMLFKGGTTCIKTNGYIFLAISRSARQGCPDAQILYIIQAEPMACAILNTPEIHGIKLPDCEGQPVREAKICMFADDRQLLSKNEDSVEQ